LCTKQSEGDLSGSDGGSGELEGIYIERGGLLLTLGGEGVCGSGKLGEVGKRVKASLCFGMLCAAMLCGKR
jgi:hypothetical protein